MEVHGHRGCRGYYPENTIEGFLYAVELGCSAIELDVVVTKDKQLLVSHEPWMNHLYCITPEGNRISAQEEQGYNIYEMTLEEVRAFNCGDRIDDVYPEQLKKASYKPSLQRVVDVLKPFDVKINIEVKSEERWYSKFQPEVKDYASLLINFIAQNELYDKCMVQSFDPNFLNTFESLLRRPVALGLLVEEEINLEQQLEALNFRPDYFNPDYSLLNEELTHRIQEQGIRVLVWTVNDKDVIKNMIQMGVDGIISDYPDYVKEILNPNRK